MFHETNNKDKIEIVIINNNHEINICKYYYKFLYQYLHRMILISIFLILIIYYIILKFVY